MSLEEKARAIVAFSERVRAQNKDRPYEKRQDYNYTSFVWAERYLKGRAVR